MMQTDLTPATDPGGLIESVVTKGDLAKLSPQERTQYYVEVCRSVGLNPFTRPLEYISLNGKLVLYARRDAADQLRKLNGISVDVVSRNVEDDLVVVHVRARDKSGRSDEDFGAVSITGLRGEAKANAVLKAITKAKRRVTLSIAGLGFLDETEVEVDDSPRNVTPAPVSAAAELDAFAQALPAGLPPLPTERRSGIWRDSNYHLEPDKLLDGTAAWNQWTHDIIALIAEAGSSDELDKLSIDNKSLLGMLRRSDDHKDDYRRIIDAATSRRAEIERVSD